VAAEKKKQTLIASVFPIALTNVPQYREKKVPSVCGCRIVYSDSDSGNDGVLDCHDECLTIIEKTVPGLCGCGELDMDSDSNDVADCGDEYPQDPAYK
jgi:hypothetical protein